jgi:hypothetical protein
MLSTVSKGKDSQYSIPVFLFRTGGEERIVRDVGDAESDLVLLVEGMLRDSAAESS